MTLAREILRRYSALESSIQAKGVSFPLPKMGTLDPVDIAVLVTTYFGQHYKKDYRPVLKQAMAFRGIQMTDEQLDSIYHLLEEFIDWLIDTVRST